MLLLRNTHGSPSYSIYMDRIHGGSTCSLIRTSFHVCHIYSHCSLYWPVLHFDHQPILNAYDVLWPTLFRNLYTPDFWHTYSFITSRSLQIHLVLSSFAIPKTVMLHQVQEVKAIDPFICTLETVFNLRYVIWKMCSVTELASMSP